MRYLHGMMPYVACYIYSLHVSYAKLIRGDSFYIHCLTFFFFLILNNIIIFCYDEESYQDKTL